MAKVERRVVFTQIAVESGRPLYALDDEGRIWVRASNTRVAGEYVWELIESPVVSS